MRDILIKHLRDIHSQAVEPFTYERGHGAQESVLVDQDGEASEEGEINLAGDAGPAIAAVDDVHEDAEGDGVVFGEGYLDAAGLAEGVAFEEGVFEHGFEDG